jgi:membrane associated rhomboid family serine protease
MGIQDRDYTRSRSYVDRSGSGGGGGFGGGLTPVVKWLVIVNAVVFVAQILTFHDIHVMPAEFKAQLDRVRAQIRDQLPADPNAPIPEEVRQQLEKLDKLEESMVEVQRVSFVQEWFALDVSEVLHGQIWRLITHAFCHDTQNVWHILFNMAGLWWFGPALEAMRGPREFLLFYLGAALAGALAFVGMDLITGARGSAIGASGAVMGVVTLYAYHFPSAVILLFWVLPLQMRYAVFVWAAIDLYPVLLEFNHRSVGDNVGHIAHLGGMAFAFVYARLGWRLSELADPIVGRIEACSQARPRRRTNRNLRVFDPEAEPTGPRLMQPEEPDEERFREELDEVLRKMHEVGRAGLTPAEIAILDQASVRLARKRRPE